MKDALATVRQLWNDLAPARTVLRQHAMTWWQRHGDKVKNPFLLVPFEYRGYAAVIVGISAGVLLFWGNDEEADAVPEEWTQEVAWRPIEIRPNSPIDRPKAQSVRVIEPEPLTIVAPPPVPPANEPPKPASVQFHSWPPTEVLLKEERIASAPSPAWVEIGPGVHWLLFRTETGKTRTIRLEAESGERYVVKTNLETGLTEVNEQ